MGVLEDILKIQVEIRAKYPPETVPKALIFVNAKHLLLQMWAESVPAATRADEMVQNRQTMIAELPVFEAETSDRYPTDGVYVEFADDHIEKVMDA